MLKGVWLSAGVVLLATAQLAGAAPPNLLPDDPVFAAAKPRPGDQRYSIELRIISHDAKLKPELRERLLRAVERVYSQCAGVDFRVSVVAEAKGKQGKYVADQTGAKNGQYTLRENFVKFFEPWVASRVPNVIDVHVVKRFPGPATAYGHAYSEVTEKTHVIDYPAGMTRYRPSELSGNSLIIAVEPTEKAEKEMNKLRRPGTPLTGNDWVAGWTKPASDLLAHELGHILMEDLTTFNHGCIGEPNNACPRSNLMSNGGSDLSVYYVPPKFKDVLGYTPLPQVNDHQCDLLRKHDAVKVGP